MQGKSALSINLESYCLTRIRRIRRYRATFLLRRDNARHTVGEKKEH